MRVNGTLVEDKMRRFKGECAQFSFNQCLIYTHDGASAKVSTNSLEMDYSAVIVCSRCHKPWQEGVFGRGITLQFLQYSRYHIPLQYVGMTGNLCKNDSRIQGVKFLLLSASRLDTSQE